MSPDTLRKDPAFTAMTLDILENVLSRADNPGRLVDYLTEEIRELTGARCVLFIQCFGDVHRVLGVNPARHLTWAEAPERQRLYQIIHNLNAAKVWDPAIPADASQLLQQDGFGLSMTIPLNVGAVHVGAMLVLGLPDQQHIDSEIKLLTTLAATVSLVLRNSFLYENQEEIIAERTKELTLAAFTFHNMEDSVYWINPDARFWKVNASACKSLGYTNEEFLNLSVQDISPVFPKDIWQAHWQELKQAGALHFETMQRTKDGRDIPVDIIANFIELEGQEFNCALVRDISERKRTEAALQKSEERFELAMRASTDGIFDWNLQTQEIYFSPGWKRMLGYKDDELENDFSVWQKLTNPLHQTRSWEILNEHLQGKRDRYEMEFQMLHKNGHWVDILSRASATFAENGTPVRVVGTHVDITEHKRAEAALLASEARYQTAQKMGHVGNWEYTLSTGLFWGSDEAKRIYGIDSHQDNFSMEAMESCITERDRVHQALIDLIEKGTAYNLEFQISPVNSSEPKTILSIAELIKDENGTQHTVVGVILDITERKKAETDRQGLQEQLTQAQKMESVGRLAGGVAHDFNNMLGVILGRTEMLLEDTDRNLPLYDDLQEIRKAAERSASLTRQLLAFARKQVIAPRVLDLNEAVEGMLKLLRRLIGEDIDLVWMPGRALWPVNMDPAQIDQILANLCVNARDAIGGVGKLTIQTECVVIDEGFDGGHGEAVPCEYVMLVVSDDGCGMDKQTISRLFEPFFTTKEVGKGTGLGLATIYGIVKQNNGFINVYSEPGQGTTFRIYLPRHQGETIQEPEKLQRGEGARGHQTILLVEDEPTILTITTAMLKRLGYRVLAAANPAEAIGIAGKKTQDIDLLLTDVVMPGMNGRDLHKHLRSFQPHLKTLFMSGYTADIIAHRGVPDEGVAFIEKPFSKKDLAAKLLWLLELG
jgi:PAS domain S-box-containing protein